MYIFYFIVVIIIVITLFLYTLVAYNTPKMKLDFMQKLYTYKLGNNKYITSVQYVNYENKIKLIIYSKDKNININKSVIFYEKYSENCNIVFAYRDEFYNLNLFEISTKNNLIPKILLLNDINIIIPKSNRNNNHKFVSCYAVMSNFERPLLLTELIESSIHFGVTKLVFYYYSSSEKVKQILKYYSDIGVVDVYQYQNDTNFKENEGERDLHIFHFLLFKINHCFNEYKTESNHMIFLDLDEIIWPVKSKNYEDMLVSITPKGFYHLHEFFYKFNYEVPDNIEKNITTILPDVDIFSINKYCPTYDGYNHKYIMLNTSDHIAADVHNPIPKHQVHGEYISSDIAFIRHTRRFNGAVKEHCPDSSIIQKNMTKLERMILKKSKRIVYDILK